RDRGVRRLRPDDDRAHRPLALLRRAGARRRRARVPPADRARAAAAAGRAALLLDRRRGGGRRHRGRNRRVPAARGGRAAAAVRLLPLRRPLAACEASLRARVHGDDPGLRARQRAPFPRVADRQARAALACVPRRARVRLGPLALRALGRGLGLVVALGAGGLASPLSGRALGRWARPARVRRLAAGAGAAPPSLPALLEARDRPDRRAALGWDLPERAAPAAPLRPLERRLRAGAPGQARARLARAALGRGPPLHRAPGTRAGRTALRGPAAEPDRRERGRHRAPAGETSPGW